VVETGSEDWAADDRAADGSASASTRRLSMTGLPGVSSRGWARPGACRGRGRRRSGLAAVSSGPPCYRLRRSITAFAHGQQGAVRSPGAVAQSGSAPRSHRGGQGFKSPQLHPRSEALSPLPGEASKAPYSSKVQQQFHSSGARSSRLWASFFSAVIVNSDGTWV
jgi:hypothetical protein